MKKHIPRNFIILNPISYFKNQGSFLFPVILTILFTFINVSAVLAQDSFENNLDGWENVLGDDFDWTNLTGLTPTRAGNAANATGPTTGSNGSYYMYIETSFPRIAGNKAWFQKPFDFTERTKPQMSFNYHLFGATIGTLNVLVSANGGAFTNVFSISGNQGDVWRLKIIDLSAYAGQNVIIRFEGIVGSSFTGDLAIDNVNVFSYDKEEDVDNDGIADKNDLDSDNDGILNSVEGSCTLTQSGVWTMSGQTASYNFGNGVIANVVVTNNTATDNFTTGAFNNLTAWDQDLAGDASLQGVFNWNSVMTVTYVDTNGDPVYVKNPTINFDRVGGSEGTTQNSAVINLLNGLTWRKLAGTDDFLATSTSVKDDGATLQQSATYSAESSQNDIDGTAAGTVEIDGLVSTFTVNFTQLGPAGAGGDGIEFILFACKATDSDNDGIPNYLDFDSDNDGCTDANEAYFGSIDKADIDNDGFYGSGTPTSDAQGRVSGASYGSLNPYYVNAAVVACNDNDNDGVPDNVDVDDDNDGILDADEIGNCGKTGIWTDLGNGVWESSMSADLKVRVTMENFTTYWDAAGFPQNGPFDPTCANFDSDYGPLQGEDGLQVLVGFQPAQPAVLNTNFIVEYIDTAGNPVKIENPKMHWAGVGGTNGNDINTSEWTLQADNTARLLSTFNGFEMVNNGKTFRRADAGTDNGQGAPDCAGGEGSGSISINGVVSSYTFNIVQFNSTGAVDFTAGDGIDFIFEGCKLIDTDNDGIPDKFDTDSDNDGCPDAIEGAATLTLDKLSTFTGGSVGGSSQNLGSNVDANGSPIVSGQGATGFTQASTNDVKDANVSLACAIDLNITKKVDKPILKIGETVTFTLVLTNAGPQPATNVQVRDLLPAGLTYNAASSVIATNTTYNPTTGIWDLSSLTIGVNDSVELKIAATINTLGVIITNNTEIFSTTETDKDSTPNSNN